MIRAASIATTATVFFLSTLLMTTMVVSSPVFKGSLVSEASAQTTNKKPVASAIANPSKVNEGSSFTLDGSRSSDSDGTIVSYVWTQTAGPSVGQISPSKTATVTAPQVQSDTTLKFTLKVTDNKGATATSSSVGVSVKNINQAPTAYPASSTTTVNTAVTFTIRGTDPDGQVLRFVPAPPSYTTAQGGKITGPANYRTTSTETTATWTYTPPKDFVGTDTFTYQATDTSGAKSNTATVTITITGPTQVNRPPVADPQSVTTAEDTAKSITLTASDADGNALTYTVVTLPTHGTLTGTAPNLQYTPAPNYNGPDSFTFKVNDGTVDSNTATVSITVNPANDAPIAVSESGLVDEDTPSVIPLTASDPDGDALTYSIVTGPAHGTVTPPSGNEVTYTPAENYNGPDSFTFKVNDGTTDSNTATITITVGSANDAPTALAGTAATDEDTATTFQLPVATDADGDTLTYSKVTDPSSGTVTISGSGEAIYTPNENFNGEDSFTYKVNDGTTDSNTATITMTVNPANDAPTASPTSATTAEDTAKAIPLTASDIDGDTLDYIVVANPAHGTATIDDASGVATYTPAANYFGTDEFTYKVNDGTTDSNVATVSLTVTAVNDPPVANAGLDRSVQPSSTVSLDGTASNDPDGTISYSWTRVSGPTVTLSGPTTATPTFTAPAASTSPYTNPVAIFTFRLTVTDNSGATATDDVTITVADTIAPTVTSTVPPAGATGVDDENSLRATFSERMNTGTITSSTFTLTRVSTGASVSGSVSSTTVTSGGIQVTQSTFNPSNDLSSSTQYRATVTTAVTDLAGNQMTTAHTWTFTTGSG